MNWNTVIDSAEQIVEVPKLCFIIPIPINKERLIFSFYRLISYLHPDYNQFCKKQFETAKNTLNRDYLELDPMAWSINLNHLPELVGSDRWNKHCGNTDMIISEGADPTKFTKLLTELDNLYLGNVIKKIMVYHELSTKRKFQGVVNIIWIEPNSGYNFHTDKESDVLRYHVPLVTNNDVHWLFEQEGKYSKLHMPVGNVWEFHPLKVNHTVRNNSNVARAHLVISEIINV
jgi:hypothetical protein